MMQPLRRVSNPQSGATRTPAHGGRAHTRVRAPPMHTTAHTQHLGLNAPLTRHTCEAAGCCPSHGPDGRCCTRDGWPAAMRPQTHAHERPASNTRCAHTRNQPNAPLSLKPPRASPRWQSEAVCRFQHQPHAKQPGAHAGSCVAAGKCTGRHRCHCLAAPAAGGAAALRRHFLRTAALQRHLSCCSTVQRQHAATVAQRHSYTYSPAPTPCSLAWSATRLPPAPGAAALLARRQRQALLTRPARVAGVAPAPLTRRARAWG